MIQSLFGHEVWCMHTLTLAQNIVVLTTRWFWQFQDGLFSPKIESDKENDTESIFYGSLYK